MTLFAGKHSSLFAAAVLAALVALSWDALSPAVWAQEPKSRSGYAADEDPFGGLSNAEQREREEVRKYELEREREREANPAARGAQHANAPSDPDRQVVVWAESSSPASQKIRQALDSQLSSAGLDFANTPMLEIVDFIRDEYDIEVQVDTTALDDLGIGVDEPITCDLRNISLGSALRNMLQQLELTYVIADEVLLVTTQEECESRLSVAAYPVGNLAGHGKNLKPLVEALIDTVATETWAANGGGVAEIRTLPGGILVISQTAGVHEELANVLTAIRKAQRLNQ